MLIRLLPQLLHHISILFLYLYFMSILHTHKAAAARWLNSRNIFNALIRLTRHCSPICVELCFHELFAVCSIIFLPFTIAAAAGKLNKAEFDFHTTSSIKSAVWMGRESAEDACILPWQERETTPMCHYREKSSRIVLWKWNWQRFNWILWVSTVMLNQWLRSE